MLKCEHAGAIKHLDMGDIKTKRMGATIMFCPVRGVYRVVFKCCNLPHAKGVECE